MGKREEIEERRAKRRGSKDDGRAAQEEKDLEAIDALEEADDEVLSTLSVGTFVEGIPALVAFRRPSPAQYKRYIDTYGRAAEKKDVDGRLKSQETLARSVWAYPADDETRKRMLEELPGLLVSIAVEAPKLAEAHVEAEGKS